MARWASLVTVFSLSACGGADVPASATRVPRTVSVETPPPLAEEPSAESEPTEPAGMSDAETTPSGLKSKVLIRGTGTVHPARVDRVRVNYAGWTTKGEMFDSTATRGGPTDLPVAGLTDGWIEALQLMVVGEKRRVWMPARIAYTRAPATTPFTQDLIYEIELLEIFPAQAPDDVASPPATAKTTASGLAYRFLARHKGMRPTRTDRVQVEFSAWTAAGELFDSSLANGRPSSFKLDSALPGFVESLMLMAEGEKARFWIPADLAYGKNPVTGDANGMMVYEIELLKIE